MTCQKAVQSSENRLDALSIINDQPKKHLTCSDERCAGGFELAPGEVHPWHKPSMPSPEKIKSSPTYPIVITPNPMVKTQVQGRLSRRDEGVQRGDDMEQSPGDAGWAINPVEHNNSQAVALPDAAALIMLQKYELKHCRPTQANPSTASASVSQ
jgi:hypothetical protein